MGLFRYLWIPTSFYLSWQLLDQDTIASQSDCGNRVNWSFFTFHPIWPYPTAPPGWFLHHQFWISFYSECFCCLLLVLRKMSNLYTFTWPHLKKIFFRVFIEFVTILLLFYVLVFWLKACGILAPQPGNKPTSPALEGKVFTIGPPGKSRHDFIFSHSLLYSKLQTHWTSIFLNVSHSDIFSGFDMLSPLPETLFLTSAFSSVNTY